MIAPYSTCIREYFFYFPFAGAFEHHPVGVTKEGGRKCLAQGKPLLFNVGARLALDSGLSSAPISSSLWFSPSFTILNPRFDPRLSQSRPHSTSSHGPLLPPRLPRSKSLRLSAQSRPPFSRPSCTAFSGGSRMRRHLTAPSPCFITGASSSTVCGRAADTERPRSLKYLTDMSVAKRSHLVIFHSFFSLLGPIASSISGWMPYGSG